MKFRPSVWLFVAAAVAVIATAFVLVLPKRHAGTTRTADQQARKLQEFRDDGAPGATAPEPAPVLPTFTPPAPPQPLPPESVTKLMNEWAHAIVVKDADAVERLHEEFRSRPSELLPAIMDCAESHAVPQVRAFCTRVLGNVRQPAAGPRLQALLGDSHEFVRSNAAWALAELGDRSALAKLERLGKKDPSEAVRKEAAAAVARLGSAPASGPP